MKIQNLRRKIIINITASVILLLIAAGVSFYIVHAQDSGDQAVIKIRNETNMIKSQTRELESQTKDTRKYKEVWKMLGEGKKKLQGIKMDEVNSLLDGLVEKYNIYNQSLQVSVPENLDGGVFQRQTLSVSYSNGNLSFETLSDVKTIDFINEFFGNLPGYIIISSIDINKARKYTQEDFVNISQGKNPGIIKVKIVFGWYVYHEKAKQITTQPTR